MVEKHRYLNLCSIVSGSSPIIVSNVNVDEFSSLLTFMYTGYLDLNLSNIYNILLATHILHMPRALEICRSFLLQSQPTVESSPSIIKPIPSRKAAAPTQHIFSPTFSHLQKSEATPFRPVITEKPLNSRPSTSKTIDISTFDVSDKQLIASEKPKSDKSKHKKKSCDSSTNNNTTNRSAEKVIIDIACCDGPVRFHRVINKFYEQQLQQQPSENSYEMQEENQIIADENQESNSAEMFTCLYCNHTFKSQYCYQKHARRHLNPVTSDTNKTISTVTKETKREVKQLDMNVQYYPCKTCGSKFPSYYFVHKHRKLCHSEEMADSSNKNNEMIAEGENNSDSGSAIDVEAINNDPQIVL